MRRLLSGSRWHEAHTLVVVPWFFFFYLVEWRTLDFFFFARDIETLACTCILMIIYIFPAAKLVNSHMNSLQNTHTHVLHTLQLPCVVFACARDLSLGGVIVLACWLLMFFILSIPNQAQRTIRCIYCVALTL